MPVVLRVGLTGGIASGKTAVSDALGALGAVVVDADVLAREVVEPGTSGLRAVVERFGPDVLDADGRLDRAALGAIVFADPAARRELETIIHPRVRARATAIESAAAPDAVVVHVIPLLVETGQAEAYEVVLVVDVAPEVQLRRLMARTGLDADAARARIAAQASRAERLAAADVVLDNNGTRAQLDDQVQRVWPEVRSRATPN